MAGVANPANDLAPDHGAANMDGVGKGLQVSVTGRVTIAMLNHYISTVTGHPGLSGNGAAGSSIDRSAPGIRYIYPCMAAPIRTGFT